MRCAATAVFTPGGNVPAASASVSSRAWARKPIFGSGDQIFSTPADIVTTTSQASGRSVTQARRARPILMMTVVPRAKAITDRSWFAMPNNGQRLSAMPEGSIAP